jgi:hypothetical protein
MGFEGQWHQIGSWAKYPVTALIKMCALTAIKVDLLNLLLLSDSILSLDGDI